MHSPFSTSARFAPLALSTALFAAITCLPSCSSTPTSSTTAPAATATASAASTTVPTPLTASAAVASPSAASSVVNGTLNSAVNGTVSSEPTLPTAPTSRYNSRPEVQRFMQEMASKHGLSLRELDKTFADVRYSPTIVKFIMPPAQPGRKSWRTYRSRFVEPIRIKAGIKFWQQNAEALKRAEATYGVPAEVIVGIIGVETIYGRDMGDFRVIDALTVLAFDYPAVKNQAARSALFREQLEDYLLWCRETKRDVFTLTGSFAGAVGIPQFMPTSIRKYAVDFDGDGAIDLRNNPVDAIGSVANFLKQHGWQTGRPVAWRIADDAGSQGIAEAAADGDPEPKRKLESLLKAGMRLDENVDTYTEKDTDVVMVDLPTVGQKTEYMIGLKNFYVLTRYNRSFFYALSVYQLGQAVKAKLPSQP